MIPSNVRVFVCPEPQDMRRGFDRLALTVRAEMGGDPRNGAFFVFVSRRGVRERGNGSRPGHPSGSLTGTGKRIAFGTGKRIGGGNAGGRAAEGAAAEREAGTSD